MILSEIVLTVDGIDPLELFGENNIKLNLLRKAFPDIQVTSRGNKLRLYGDKKYTQKAKARFESMVRYLKANSNLPLSTVEELLSGNQPFNNGSSARNDQVILHGTSGKPIRAKTENQRKLVDYCAEKDIVFAIGPAGTGKTYTAVAIAVSALKNRQVKKIILTRPAVEAGENLGFLPGDLQEKIDPYLRPLYDALDDMIPAEKLRFFMDNRVIEVAPLAFMRGRTLDNAYIILDEAQNCTTTQLKMFLTRLGPSAKCIITGDLSQIDLPKSQGSGLFKSVDLLGNLDGIGTVFLDADDVVRHRLVKQIIRAYSRDDARRNDARRAKYEEE
ncbi:MAG: phosphate starvation-inducible protein PhoH [Bacteroidetes bacterium]|nr:MAG: phosphate starvation-inducible protein PhoH [Bacteroidota bacterium]